jgi:hypothetical protein
LRDIGSNFIITNENAFIDAIVDGFFESDAFNRLLEPHRSGKSITGYDLNPYWRQEVLWDEADKFLLPRMQSIGRRQYTTMAGVKRPLEPYQYNSSSNNNTTSTSSTSGCDDRNSNSAAVTLSRNDINDSAIENLIPSNSVARIKIDTSSDETEEVDLSLISSAPLSSNKAFKLPYNVSKKSKPVVTSDEDVVVLK